MTFWHIMTELFFVGIIILGGVVFVDTIKGAFKDEDDA